MKKNICIVTSTRAEFGLLKPLISRIDQHHNFNLQLVVTGTHLAEKFGKTINEIRDLQDFEVCREIPIIDEKNLDNVSLIMANVLEKFSKCFDEIKPDMVVILGDRYEIFAVASVATTLSIPICHLHGGETTEGAIDEVFRHSISKMSYLHFTSTEAYRRRVIQLGENPKRVFNVGAVANESIENIKFLVLKELERNIDFKVTDKTFLVTFHPVTIDGKLNIVYRQFNELLEALKLAIEKYNLKFIFTKANADAGGLMINELIDKFVAENTDSVTAFYSLGQQRYFSALKYSAGVIGNSSSGIIEVPMFNKITINIGDRQKGRIQAESIINCQPEKKSIINAIEGCLIKNSTGNLEINSPYCRKNNLNGLTISEFIIEKISEAFEEGIELKKQFYDIR